MRIALAVRAVASLALGALVCACTTVPAPSTAAAHALAVEKTDTESLAAMYARLDTAGGVVMTLRPAASHIHIYVYRAGRAASLGHNHVLTAPVLDGYFYWSDAGPAHSRFDLRFRLDQIIIDYPTDRTDVGAGSASTLSAEAIAATREHMLGPDNMQALIYPMVCIHSLDIVGESPRFAVRLAVEMHGQSREMWVPVTVTGLPQHVHASGAVVLRQTDFGIQPYSVLNGMLAVQDAVLVEFDLAGGR